MPIVEENQLPCRADHLLEYAMEDELTLYDHQAEMVHILNSTAALVWRLCDGARSPQEIARELAAAYGLEPDTVVEDVREILAQLYQARLLASR